MPRVASRSQSMSLTPEKPWLGAMLRLLSNQLHRGSCRRSPACSTQTKCSSAAWTPAKGSEIPASVEYGSPRESWRSELSDLVQMGSAGVIVAGAPDAAGSACAGSRKDDRVERHYAVSY